MIIGGYHMLVSASEHAARMMKRHRDFSDTWRAWCKASLQLAEEAERVSKGRVFSWEKDR